MSGNKHIIGLCGGIGSGKSTVARLLADAGCAVVDADIISHDILQNPDIIDQITQWWGPIILDEDGQPSRSAIAKIVFSDESQLQRLTDLLHPVIAHKEQQLIETFQADPDVLAIVLDVPLLFEAGQNEWCDEIIFIKTDEKCRLDRVKATKGWDEKTLKKVENLQLALDTKAKISDYTVDNNSGIPGLSVQVASILSRILDSDKKSPR